MGSISLPFIRFLPAFLKAAEERRWNSPFPGCWLPCGWMCLQVWGRCLILCLHPWWNSLSLCPGRCSKHTAHLGFRAGAFWLPAVTVGCLPRNFQFAKPSSALWLKQLFLWLHEAVQAPCPRIMLLSEVPVMSAVPVSPHLLFKMFWNLCCH